MTQVSLKNVQLALQKITTWMKKSGKGHQEWDKACRVVGLALRKLKTLVKRKVFPRDFEVCKCHQHLLSKVKPSIAI
jgi:hypothetical protein